MRLIMDYPNRKCTYPVKKDKKAASESIFRMGVVEDVIVGELV